MPLLKHCERGVSDLIDWFGLQSRSNLGPRRLQANAESMRSSTEILKSAIGAGTAALQSIAALESQITEAADLIVNCLTNGNKVLACGNGGSAADAADFCTEFACRFVEDRRPYPALNLSQGGSLLTAIGNDYGFEQIFARQVAAFGATGDVLIAISTSGNSKNISAALKQGRAR